MTKIMAKICHDFSRSPCGIGIDFVMIGLSCFCHACMKVPWRICHTRSSLLSCSLVWIGVVLVAWPQCLRPSPPRHLFFRVIPCTSHAAENWEATVKHHFLKKSHFFFHDSLLGISGDKALYATVVSKLITDRLCFWGQIISNYRCRIALPEELISITETDLWEFNQKISY